MRLGTLVLKPIESRDAAIGHLESSGGVHGDLRKPQVTAARDADWNTAGNSNHRNRNRLREAIRPNQTAGNDQRTIRSATQGVVLPNLQAARKQDRASIERVAVGSSENKIALAEFLKSSTLPRDDPVQGGPRVVDVKERSPS